MIESNKENNEKKLNLKGQITNEIEKIFKYFLKLLKNVNKFYKYLDKIENQISDEKSRQKLKEDFILIKEKIVNINSFINKEEDNKESKEEIDYKPNNNSKLSYSKFYDSSHSHNNESYKIEDSDNKDKLLQSFIIMINLKLKEFFFLLNSNYDKNFPNLSFEDFSDIDNQIKILKEVNDIYLKLSKNNEIVKKSYNDNSENILDISNIDEIDNNSFSSTEIGFKLIDITDKKQLDEYINNKDTSIYIKSFVIKEENFYNISILEKCDFSYLEKLDLRTNEIIDISPLKSCGLCNLVILDLENNNINNNCIEILKQMKMPKIRDLNLFKNKITSIKIFDILTNFKTLKLFYIGENLFDEKELNNNKNKIIYLDNLEELGLTNNFNVKTNYFINNIILDNIKYLYINKNEFNSLEFLKNIKFNRLETFWAVGNNLKDLKEISFLNNKKGIKEICLRGNQIENIDEDILDLLDLFPSLKILNLYSNPINIKKAQKILNKIEERISDFRYDKK